MMGNEPVQRIFVIAGEPSGDQIGGRLLALLKRRSPMGLEFHGVGGEAMKTQGLMPLFPMSDLTHMGLAEVVTHIPLLFKRYRQLVSAMKHVRPHVLVTIDLPDFSFRLAKKARRLGIKTIHIGAPTVWAWRANRARQVAQFLDHLCTLYPFEPPYFQKHGLPTTFVGHPLVEQGIDRIDAKEFLACRALSNKTPLLCLLPGSRPQEVKRLLPIFQQVIPLLQKDCPDLNLVIPLAENVAPIVRQAQWNCPTLYVTRQEQKYEAMKAADVALAASGTVSLELAMANTPMVIAYKVNALTASLARYLLKTPYVSLPNILLNEPVVSECLQERCTAEILAHEVRRLLVDEQAASRQRRHLKTIQSQLSCPHDRPSGHMARIILDHLNPSLQNTA